MATLKLFLLLTVVIFSPFGSLTVALAEELRDLRAGVVKILSINKLEGKLRTGTGFIVRLEEQATYIVTAAHVTKGDPNPQVAFFPQANRFYPGKTLGTESGKEDGVAVLVVEGSPPKGLRSLVVNPVSTIPEGEEITVIGFPVEANTPWVISKGVLAGRRGTNITFTGLVGEGNSGGPLLLNGHVLGIVTEMRAKVGYAVPMVTAQIALEGWGVAIEQTTYETEAAKLARKELEKVQAELEALHQRDEERTAEMELLRKKEKLRTAELDAIKKREEERVVTQVKERRRALWREYQELEQEYIDLSTRRMSEEFLRERLQLSRELEKIAYRQSKLRQEYEIVQQKNEEGVAAEVTIMKEQERAKQVEGLQRKKEDLQEQMNALEKESFQSFQDSLDDEKSLEEKMQANQNMLFIRGRKKKLEEELMELEKREAVSQNKPATVNAP